MLVPAPITLTAGPLAELITHDPEDGRLLSTTEPVLTVQVGCVGIPTVGASGIAGAALICTLAEAADVHEPFETV